jgi:RNA polymerase sigma-70 factor (ECF subfamily)
MSLLCRRPTERDAEGDFFSRHASAHVTAVGWRLRKRSANDGKLVSDMQLSDETLFAAYRTHGDCDALGQIFRRRADELLRMAAFMAPTPSEAEDLVQATFLTAITRADTFHRDGRLMSWLCGILANHARMLRRAQSRRPNVPMITTDADDAATVTLRAELRGALDHAVANLREPYRSVLSLHLHDGLDSGEISRSLHRAPATVRKQLERGLDQIRRALPLGLATGIVIRINPAQIAMHAQEAARAATEQARWTASGREVTAADTGKGVVWPAAITIAGLLLSAALWQAATPSQLASQHLPLATAATAPTLRREDATSSPPHEPPAQRTAATAAMPYLVRAQVSWADGSPAAGTNMCLVPDNDLPLAMRQLDRTAQHAAVAADGSVEFNVTGSGTYALTATGTMHQQVFVVDGRTAVTMQLAQPRDVRGRVLEPTGAPCSGAQVWLSDTAANGNAGVVYAVTNGRGEFALRAPALGCRIYARAPGYAQSPADRLGSGRMDLRLQTRGGGLRVLVHNTQGEAVADAHVSVAPTCMLPEQALRAAIHHLRTDACGEALIPDLRANTYSVVARATGFGPRVAAVDVQGDVKVSIHLEPPSQVIGRVTTHNGQGLAGVSVTAKTKDLASRPVAAMSTCAARTDSDGRFKLTDVPSGLVRIQATTGTLAGEEPRTPTVLAYGVVAVAPGTTSEFHATARRAHVIEGLALGSDAQPLANCSVIAVPSDLTPWSMAVFRVQQARTDAGGRFVFHDVDNVPHRVAVLGPKTHDGRVGLPLAVAGAVPNCPVVVRGAEPMLPGRIVGRVEHGQEPLSAVHVSLTHKGLGLTQGVILGANGHIDFRDLPRANYRVAVKHSQFGVVQRDVDTWPPQGTFDLGTISFADPCHVEVLVLDWTGTPAHDTLVQIADPDGVVLHQERTGLRGVATATIAPGPYRLRVFGRRCAPTELPLAAASGKQTAPVRSAPAVPYRMLIPFERAQNPQRVFAPLRLTIGRDSDPPFVVVLTEEPADDCFWFELALPIGLHTIHAQTIWGARGSVAINVDETSEPRQVQMLLERPGR